MKSIRDHYPKGDVTVAADFMVLNIKSSGITRRRAVISDWAWYPLGKMYSDLNVPKYHNPDGSMDPTAQIDQSQEIPPTDPTTGKVNYQSDGY